MHIDTKTHVGVKVRYLRFHLRNFSYDALGWSGAMILTISVFCIVENFCPG
jgi:hypothetical protein